MPGAWCQVHGAKWPLASGRAQAEDDRAMVELESSKLGRTRGSVSRTAVEIVTGMTQRIAAGGRTDVARSKERGDAVCY